MIDGNLSFTRATQTRSSVKIWALRVDGARRSSYCYRFGLVLEDHRLKLTTHSDAFITTVQWQFIIAARSPDNHQFDNTVSFIHDAFKKKARIYRGNCAISLVNVSISESYMYVRDISSPFFFQFFFFSSFFLSLSLLFLFITRYNRETVRPLTFK